MAEPLRPSAAVPPPPQGPAKPSHRSSRPLQFSLRAMLIATAAFAAVAALSTLVGLVQLVVLVAGLGLLYVVPVALGTIAVYSRGMRRTFFAGAFAGSLASHYMHWHLEWGDSIFQALILVGLVGMTSVCCGLTAWISRRFVERRGWHLPSSDQGE